MNRMDRCDVAIIGAGIIGLSTAYQIARRSRLSVAVFDKAVSIGEGSTGASSAVCRHRYTAPEMVQLAADGVSAYRRWHEFLRNGSPLAKFHDDGVLWMPGEDKEWADREHLRLSDLDIRTEVLDDQALKERYPALNPCILTPDFVSATEHECIGGGRHLLEVDGGYIDPMDTAQDLLTACSREGVNIQLATEVNDLPTSGNRISGIALADGSSMLAPVVINAAGPWYSRFIDKNQMNFPWVLEPTRIQVAHVSRNEEIVGPIPVCADLAGGIYFRSQNRGQQLVVGSTRPEDEIENVNNPDRFNRLADDDYICEKLFALQHRLPAYSYSKEISGYSGLYTINRQDAHPIVGSTSIDGYYVAVGFSGHGFKLAPAIGSLLAQTITGETGDFDTAVDPDFLSVDREPIVVDEMSALA